MSVSMKIKNGFKYEKNGWIYVSIKGKPYERGYAQGYLLADEIKDAFKTLKYSLYEDSGIEYEFYVEISNFMFKKPTQEYFPEFLEEMKGITDGANKRGAGVTLDEIVLWNNIASLDYVLGSVREHLDEMPVIKEKYAHFVSAMPSGAHEGGAKDKCSAFIAVGDYTHDGKIVCGHNSFDNFLSGQYYNIIIDLKPTKGNRIIYQGSPGYISSQTDFFVTSAGFIGTETTIGGFSVFEANVPISCRIRRCMQYAKTLDEYVEFLKERNSGDYANSWLIGDIKNNEIMLIELGLDYVNVERKKNGYFIGFNAPYDPRIRNLECVNTGFDDIRRHQGARKVRLEELMEYHKGKINIEIGEAIIADHYDVYLKKENPCSRTCCGHYELDDRAFMSQADRPLPYQPRGAVDGTVCDSNLAQQMGFMARWGSSCGLPFDKTLFMKEHAQWKRYEPYLKDRPSQPWTLFKSLDKLVFDKDNKKTKRIRKIYKRTRKNDRK
jgi:hypothetical protein